MFVKACVLHLSNLTFCVPLDFNDFNAETEIWLIIRYFSGNSPKIRRIICKTRKSSNLNSSYVYQTTLENGKWRSKWWNSRNRNKHHAHQFALLPPSFAFCAMVLASRRRGNCRRRRRSCFSSSLAKAVRASPVVRADCTVESDAVGTDLMGPETYKVPS